MADSKIKDESYFQVSGWMLNRLNLKGVALHVFAIIFGFSQDGEGSFTGSLQYLCDFTNSSKNTVLKALKELVDKEYVTKTENTINGVRFCTYKSNAPVVQKLNRGGAETEPGVVQKLNRGGAETEPNNIEINNTNNISNNIDEVIGLYHSICVSFPAVKVVSDARKKAIKARLETYSLEDFKTVFENAESSSFLKGKNDRKWSANFDWLIADKNIVKVLEGNYADKGRKEAVPGWMDKRELDDDEVMAIRRMMQDDGLAERAERLRLELQGE